MILQNLKGCHYPCCLQNNTSYLPLLQCKRKVYAFQLALNLRDKFSPFKNIELLNNLHNAFEVFGRLIMVEPYNLRRLIIGNIKKQAESNYNHYIFYTCKYSNVSIFVFWQLHLKKESVKIVALVKQYIARYIFYFFEFINSFVKSEITYI